MCFSIEIKIIDFKNIAKLRAMSYSNPPENLEKRPFYGINSQDFKLMMTELHNEMAIDTQKKQYCLDCHWVFARAGVKLHKKHHRISATSIIGNSFSFFFLTLS